MIDQQFMQFEDFTNPHELDAADISDGWYTPLWIIKAARDVMGGIDLDPATCTAAQSVVQATTWYTPVVDGLLQPWFGRVWLNPPYSKPLPWIQRLVDHYRNQSITQALALTNCSCSPEWSQPLWRSADAVCLLSKRVNWWHPTKANAKGSYDRDSALFYFGSDRHHFTSVFSRYGAIR